MLTTYLRRRSATVLALAVIAATLVISWVWREQRRHALERLREKYESMQALLRYVQLHRQCSEETAYQRLAAFVKRHAPLDEQPSIEYMVTHYRQGLFELAQSILGGSRK
jgi:hypothetical protein